MIRKLHACLIESTLEPAGTVVVGHAVYCDGWRHTVTDADGERIGGTYTTLAEAIAAAKANAHEVPMEAVDTDTETRTDGPAVEKE